MSAAPYATLECIAERYDALLCDVWGVLHDGVNAHDGAAEALMRFRERGAVILITNAPRPSAPIVTHLEGFGIARDAYDAIVSSGDVVQAHLAELGAARAYHLGPGRDLPLYDGLEIEQVGAAAEADVIVAAGLFDDRTETPEDYRARLAEMVTLEIPFLCANPDVVVERGGSMVHCAGALAAVYEEEGGRPLQFGKPHAPIYARAREAIETRVGPDARVLVVGDGLATDVAGANRHGFDVLFITGGIHEEEVAGKDGKLDEARLAKRLAADGRRIDFHAPRLVWTP